MVMVSTLADSISTSRGGRRRDLPVRSGPSGKRGVSVTSTCKAVAPRAVDEAQTGPRARTAALRSKRLACDGCLHLRRQRRRRHWHLAFVGSRHGMRLQFCDAAGTDPHIFQLQTDVGQDRLKRRAVAFVLIQVTLRGRADVRQGQIHLGIAAQTRRWPAATEAPKHLVAATFRHRRFTHSNVHNASLACTAACAQGRRTSLCAHAESLQS